MATSSSSEELLQAHVELWNLTYSYLKSMALQCAVSLGIPNAIHSRGGAASLPDLLSILPLPEHRKPYLPRLMRFLCAIGVVTLDDGAVPSTGEGGGEGATPAGQVYRLSPLSRLLVDDARVNGCTSLAPFVLSETCRYHVGAATRLSEWFMGEEGGEAETTTTPFRMAHGTDFWGAMCRDPQLKEVFNAGMASDAQLALDFVVARCGEVFQGVGSLVDVGGGTGAAARAIAFPHVKCSVLDMPSVISGIRSVDGDAVEYIEGDMMSHIPPTDAVLLKV